MGEGTSQMIKFVIKIRRFRFLSPQVTLLLRLRSVGTASNSKESNSVAVVEGLAPFACVPVFYPISGLHDTSQSSSTTSGGPKMSFTKNQGYYYSCTVRKPQIMLERLSKEIAEVADGPVNLLETMGFEIQFRKTLTRKCPIPTSISHVDDISEENS